MSGATTAATAAAETKSEGDAGKFPASAYAYVPDASSPSTWKLRLERTPGQGPDAGIVGAAAAALGPGFRGQKVEIPAADRPRVIARVRAAWRKANPDKDPDEMPEVLRACEAAEPSADGVHVDVPSEPASPPRRRRGRGMAFLAKLAELLRPKVSRGEFDDAVKTARAHAGGKGKAEAAASQGATAAELLLPGGMDDDDDDGIQPLGTFIGPDGDADLDLILLAKGDKRVRYRLATDAAESCGTCRFADCDCDSCALVEGAIDARAVCSLFTSAVEPYVAAESAGPINLVDFCAAHQAAEGTCTRTAALFNELPPLTAAEPPEWMPVLPKPGTYTSPRYGQIAITRQRNQRFIDNFKAGVYQEHIPIDAEHETKLSGAIGYLRGLRMNSNGSVDARVEWTDRGIALIHADAYKYVSPEWFDSWQDPAPGGATYQDVLIGAALTTRPFFKDKSLLPLVASERGLEAAAIPASQLGEPVRPPTTEGVGTTMPEPEPKAAATTTTLATTSSVTLTEDEVRRFREMETALAAAKATAEQQGAALRQASEKIAAMEADARRKRFGEVAGGWYGETAKNVTLLETLADAAGEDSNTFREFVRQQNALAEQLRQSNLFGEFGRSGGGGRAPSAFAEAEALAVEVRKTTPTLTKQQAIAQVYESHPELYERELAEGPR